MVGVVGVVVVVAVDYQRVYLQKANQKAVGVVREKDRDGQEEALQK